MTFCNIVPVRGITRCSLLAYLKTLIRDLEFRGDSGCFVYALVLLTFTHVVSYLESGLQVLA